MKASITFFPKQRFKQVSKRLVLDVKGLKGYDHTIALK